MHNTTTTKTLGLDNTIFTAGQAVL